MSRYVVLDQLQTDRYTRHALHSDGCNWPEKNCYADLWIELLNGLQLQPLAMLPFTLTVNFEGDQWTFFKPSHEEVYDLYGLEVQELTVWRPLLDHAIEQLGAGKLISTEADAFWLPDTAGTDYRTKHTKTTIVLNDLDIAAQHLGYFHNAGYYQLDGEDFIKTFRLDAAPDPTFMPLFAEFIRLDRLVKRPESELADRSWRLLVKHLARIPRSNPVSNFRDRFTTDLPTLQSLGLSHYHAWAFAATRQLGAAFELAAANLRWQTEHGHANLDTAIAAFEEISSDSKTFILKGARAVNSKRPMDLPATFNRMITAWDRGMQSLGKVENLSPQAS